jgi:ATP-dependent Clp protease ATP-binding subunit ClpC
MKEVYQRMRENEFELIVTEKLKDKLGEDGYSPTYGARPLRRSIQRLIEDPLAEALLSGTIPKSGRVVADLNDEGEVYFTHEESKSPVGSEA